MPTIMICGKNKTLKKKRYTFKSDFLKSLTYVPSIYNPKQNKQCLDLQWWLRWVLERCVAESFVDGSFQWRLMAEIHGRGCIRWFCSVWCYGPFCDGWFGCWVSRCWDLPVEVLGFVCGVICRDGTEGTFLFCDWWHELNLIWCQKKNLIWCNSGFRGWEYLQENISGAW